MVRNSVVSIFRINILIVGICKHTLGLHCWKTFFVLLIFTTLWAYSSDDRLIMCCCFFSDIFFPENRLCHFMHIVFKGDSLHEMSKLIFWKKK